MLLSNLCIFIILPVISPRPLKESQPNFPRKQQMGWNRKRWVKVLKSVEDQVGGSFSAGPAHIKSNMAKNEGIFLKKQRCLILVG